MTWDAWLFAKMAGRSQDPFEPPARIAPPDLARNSHQEPEDAAPRQCEHHLVVPQPLAALDRAEIPDQAILTAAHARPARLRKSPHARELASQDTPVNP
jgi:hypothetical protein